MQTAYVHRNQADSRGSVNVLMVHIWCVGVSVGHRLMGVLVTMAFRQTQHHSRQHHNSARQHQQSRSTLPEYC